MPKYLYEASSPEGIVSRGSLEVDSKTNVVDYLTKRNLIPVNIYLEGETRALPKLNFSLFESVKTIDKIVMVRNLAATLKAGLSILEGLDVLVVDANKKIMREILVTAKDNLQEGKPLSATFAYYPRYFAPVFVGLVKAGEASGKLDASLEELSQNLTREYNLVRKVRSALAYPFLLLVASALVVILLLIFVLPQLAKSFQNSHLALPPTTQFLVNLSRVLSYSPTLDVIALLLFISSIMYLRRTPWGRMAVLRILFRTPVVKDLIRKIALVRFTRTLSSLIKSGETILQALHLASDAIGNDIYSAALENVIEQVKRGVPLSKSLEGYPDLFPRLLISMIGVGERTGTLEGVLRTFSDFYEEEVDNALKDLTTFLEPLLLLIMGLIVGGIAFSVLLPIYQLVGKFV